MRTNGTISVELETPPTRNDYGEIVPQRNEWSEEIPCFITTMMDNRKGRYWDGEFHTASYTILVEGMSFPECGMVRLTRNEAELGEHRVISIEPIGTFKRTRIVV